MANYEVEITLTGNNFTYDPGYLQVHRGDKVRFKCNSGAFTIKFLYGNPFVPDSGGNAVEFSKDSPSTTAYGTIANDAAIQVYHYAVAVRGPDGKIRMDGGCPTLEVG